MKKNFDTALEKALNEEFAWLDDFENPYSEYQFSPGFELKMKEIIPKSEYAYVSVGRNRIRKSFLVALIVLLALAITGCAMVVHFILEWNETHNTDQGTLDITFNIEGEIPSDTGTSIVPETPAGFTITNEYQDDALYTVEYSNDIGQQILYSQQNDIENMGLSIDNEDADFEETTINGYKGYSYSKDGINALYWADGIHFYILQGTCEMKILFKMAESII